jgi:hypothetical protein
MLYQLSMILKKKENGIKIHILRMYQKNMNKKHSKLKQNILVCIVKYKIIIMKKNVSN